MKKLQFHSPLSAASGSSWVSPLLFHRKAKKRTEKLRRSKFLQEILKELRATTLVSVADIPFSSLFCGTSRLCGRWSIHAPVGNELLRSAALGAGPQAANCTRREKHPSGRKENLTLGVKDHKKNGLQVTRKGMSFTLFGKNIVSGLLIGLSY